MAEHGPSEAEVLLWALAVWMPRQDNPYIQRDLNAANAYLNRHELTDPDQMRARLEELAESSSPDREGAE